MGLGRWRVVRRGKGRVWMGVKGVSGEGGCEMDRGGGGERETDFSFLILID